MEYKISYGELEDLEGVIMLLKEHDLPSSDLISSGVRLLVAKDNNTIIGCIGLEVYGQDGFLRSFAVKPEYQSKGIGKLLVKELDKFALSLGIDTMHLLTTSAEKYFERIGYNKLDRGDAPESIKANAQFTTLCSSVAVYMSKTLNELLI